ncbi:GDSL-type esterase/lipase family protein [Nocardiopsis sp. N85]|uniref:GDSL-type esterase/lipase family protein n=1 Tax=Nocardiopsis sp. N85 TaxID=3029400 RepID=UPI00237F5FEC|nr:GDSL-type esterase/lipase family protein [Nocardiopsis sp. N85]MDE3721648.1 GDSL-type esterase/lipase family protein [Nocardiopsis sp. N85]
MFVSPFRRTGTLILSGLLAVALVIAGAYLWVTHDHDRGTDPRAEAEAPVSGSLRVMPAGDSMTQGANGDRTWRYHLWNHLEPIVEGVDFVGPYTDPATTDMIVPVPTEEDDVPATEGDGGTEPASTDGGDAEALAELAEHTWPGAGGEPGTVEYRDPDFDQDHNSVWGRTLRDAAASIEEEVRVHEPDVLCVLIGVNDLLWPVEMEEMEDRLRRYVEGARKGNPDVRIVLSEALPIAYADNDPGFALRLYAYNMLVREVADDMSTDRSPVISLDIADREDWDVEADTYDGTHPNAHGEIKIAAAFADVLAEAYGVGEPYTRPLPEPS